MVRNVTAIHPVLSDEEREKRIERVKKAIANLYIAIEKAKRGTDDGKQGSDCA